MSRVRRPIQEEPEISLTRRAFLGAAVAAGAYVAVRGLDSLFFDDSVVRGLNKPGSDIAASNVDNLAAGFEREFHSALGLDGREVKQSELQLVPEWERTGSDMFIAMPAVSSGFNSVLLDRWEGILKAIPPGTNVHVMIFEGFASALLMKLRLKFPHINFKVYEYEGKPFDGAIYSQDMLFASGKKDMRGRFKIFTSSLDNSLMRSGESDDPWMSMSLDGDNCLARKYPETFVSQSMPSRLEGGDLQSTVFPDSRSAIILGDSNFRIFVEYVRMGADFNGRDFQNHNFDYSYIGAKAMFQIFMGVDVVLVTDQDDILRRMVGMPVGDFHQIRTGFYHTDMVLCTAVTPKNEFVAFCTNTDTHKTDATDGDIAYLRRIHRQFAGFGYEIEYLPCGPYPALNYTNVLMFTPKDGVSTVMVPFYGLDSDDVAAAIYEKRGFKVIPTDMSFMKELEPDTVRDLGSLHCLVEILA